MGPVRIKYYGMLWLTRPTYLVLQSIALFFCIACLAAGFLGILLSGSVFPHRPPVLMDVLILLFWIGLLAFPLECLETYVMLRKFARAEAEQRTRLETLDAGAPAPLAPPSNAFHLPGEERPNTNIQP